MDAPAAPDHGVRFTLELERGAGVDHGSYVGAARLPGRDVALAFDVHVAGDVVTVSSRCAEGTDTRLVTVAGTLLRTTVRSAMVRGQALPRRVQRWRTLDAGTD